MLTIHFRNTCPLYKRPPIRNNFMFDAVVTRALNAGVAFYATNVKQLYVDDRVVQLGADRTTWPNIGLSKLVCKKERV